MKKGLLHGGPLDDSWWLIPDEAPRYLLPQEGLGDRGVVLIADYPVPVGAWRYERQATEDGRVVYLWGQDERLPMEFVATMVNGPAQGYKMSVLGLTEPWPYVRLAPRPPLGGLDGGHMEWLHIPWPDTPAWDGEVTYELTGTLIPPREAIPEAFYRVTEGPPWAQLERSDEE